MCLPRCSKSKKGIAKARVAIQAREHAGANRSRAPPAHSRVENCISTPDWQGGLEGDVAGERA